MWRWYEVGGLPVAARTCSLSSWAGSIRWTVEELVVTKSVGVALLPGMFVLVMFGKKISRTLEMISSTIVAFNLLSLLILVLIVVPLDHWVVGFSSLVTPAMPPQGSDPTLLGALAGFTVMTSAR